MFATSLLAQEASTFVDAVNGWTIWSALLAVGIVGLYVVISRTRKRSYRDIMTRQEHEAQMKANDPDMRSED
ncbi:MAG: hypothetical protein ABFR95_03280 [Actinomycetota bacterium]